MNVLLIIIYMSVTTYAFLKKRDYVLAIILVGHPIIKLMLKPFPVNVNEKTALMIYFIFGFFCFVIIRLVNRKETRIGGLTKKFLCLYFLFTLNILYSLIFTPNRSYGISKSMEFLSISFLIIIISILAIDGEECFLKAMKAIANISIMIGIITIALIYFNTGGIMARLGTTQAKNIVLYGINFPGSIWFGRRMGIGLVSMIFVTFVDKRKINVLKTILLLTFVFLSGSRGPILSMLITFITVFILNMRKNNVYKSYYKKFFVILILILSAIVTSIIINPNSTLMRIVSTNDRNVLGRLNMYLDCIKLIKENILGHGIGSFEFLSESIHRYPHNILLEVLVELGFQGLIIFLLGFYITIKKYLFYLKRSFGNRFSIYLNFSFTILLFAMINAQFSGDITSNEYIWFGFILMGKSIEILQVYFIEGEQF